VRTLLKCSYCGGTDFYEGPSGGLSTNILCANEKCRHWFNNSPFGLEDLKRVEPTEVEKEKKVAEAAEETSRWRRDVYNEGRDLFKKGSPARDCITVPTATQATIAEVDIVRLAGWLDEMSNRWEVDIVRLAGWLDEMSNR